MSMFIKEVTGKSDLKKFIGFYSLLYRHNKQLAMPLHMDELSTLSQDKNPAHQFCQCKYWLAYRNKQIVGRIAAIINTKEQEKEGKAIGRFGWFDFVNDPKISKALLQTAASWLKTNGVVKAQGPMGFTDMDRQGLLIEGHDEQGTMATLYNYPYYEAHFTALKMEKAVDWIEFELNTGETGQKKLNLLAQRVRQQNKLQSVNITSSRQLKKLAPAIFQLINESYQDLYGYIPLTEEQIAYYTKNYLSFVNFKLISVVTDAAGQVVGAGIAMPSFTRALQKAKGKLFPLGAIQMYKALKKNDKLDLYLIAVDAKYQKKGATAIIMSDIINGAIEEGIHQAETNIELEDNQHIQAMWRFFPHRQHKRRRCYVKTISND
ncbi:MAG: hypothetical protein JEZ14_26620 [Marinilabiliaceae bacterium]|nr:hypothetical protein [Marinilabiliaceae bacterium]